MRVNLADRFVMVIYVLLGKWKLKESFKNKTLIHILKTKPKSTHF